MSNLNVGQVTATTGVNLPNFTNATRPATGSATAAVTGLDAAAAIQGVHAAATGIIPPR